MTDPQPVPHSPTRLLGELTRDAAPAPLAEAVWYRAQREGDGLHWGFPPGALAGQAFLTADMLLDGTQLAVLRLSLREGGDGPEFFMHFGLLNQCQARMVVPLEAIRQGRWMWPRRGAFLKPLVSGDRVSLERVDRMTLTLLRKGEGPVRWCQTAVRAVVDEPAALEDPLLPVGPLVDELGQSLLHDWPGRTRSQQELGESLHRQLARAPQQTWPGEFTRWGGWKHLRLQEGNGFFTTRHDGRRWWLVDPDGYAFWSAGCNCVTGNVEANVTGLGNAIRRSAGEGALFDAFTAPGRQGPSLNFLAANLSRVFGRDEWKRHWQTLAVAALRQAGFNTVANWSDWQLASAAAFPYVRPLRLEVQHVGMVFRDFPDVFDPGFRKDARQLAEQLRPTVDDPAMIGYFLMNEPTWGFAAQTPAEGMLLTAGACATRGALADWLAARHGDDAGLSRAWGVRATLEDVRRGPWRQQVPPAARGDLEAFSTVMARELFGTLTEACRQVDGRHLCLGVRYYIAPPDWALDAMKCFDVFSMNCYYDVPPARQLEEVSRRVELGVMLGEWHFGALDAGLPASGIGRVATQADRGRAFRVYTEQAAAGEWCVGAHWFTLYDQSALGRFDGENYNIGFLDVCHRPYEPLMQQARAAHEALYRIAAGQQAPSTDAVEYLPRLFM